jgi:hypothetical protein
MCSSSNKTDPSYSAVLPPSSPKIQAYRRRVSSLKNFSRREPTASIDGFVHASSPSRIFHITWNAPSLIDLEIIEIEGLYITFDSSPVYQISHRLQERFF